MRSFSYFIVLLSLAGCSFTAPGPMPRGYSSYDKELKSVDGEQAKPVGYDYSINNNKAVLDDMRVSASSLVDMLDKKLNFSIDSVYLNIPANTTFYNSFDYLIRDELVKKGYVLSSTAEDAIRIDFVANKIISDCSNNAYLALAIDVVDKVPDDFVAGFYQVPLYGYKYTGNVKIDIPPCH